MFPHDPAEWPSMDAYFARRKQTVGVLILINEFVVNYSYLPVMQNIRAHDCAEFWR